VPIGGGGLGTSTSPLASVNATQTTSQLGGGWVFRELNSSTGPNAIRAYAICAGT
jgi:hypothetical protein